MTLTCFRAKIINYPEFDEFQWGAILGSIILRDPDIASTYLEALCLVLPLLRETINLEDRQQIILHVVATDLSNVRCDYEIDYMHLNQLSWLTGITQRTYLSGNPIRELITLISHYPCIFLQPNMKKFVSFTRAYLSGRDGLEVNGVVSEALLREHIKGITFRISGVLRRYAKTEYPIEFKEGLENALGMIKLYLEP